MPPEHQFDRNQLELQRRAYGASAANCEQWLRELYRHVSTPPGARGPLPLRHYVREDLGRAALARHGGADPDRADYKDTLGILPAAKGVGTFLVHPDTPATAMAVYGPWGHGKSTFMKLVEEQMLLQAALEQVGAMELTADGLLHAEYKEIRERIQNQKATDADRQLLQALASPRLMTVWFNAWEYLNEEQVWSGLVVEVIKRLEERLGSENRALMRRWWRSWGCAIKLRLPLRWLLAWQYNWQQRCALMWFTWLLPILLTACILLPLAVFGSMQLFVNKDHSMKALGLTVLTAAPLGTALLAVERTFKVVKDASALIEAAEAHMSLKHHHSRVGYQQAVKKDILVFRTLLEQHLQPLADYRPRPCTTVLAVRAAALQQAEHAQRHADAAATANKDAHAAERAAICTSHVKEAEYAAHVAQEANKAADAAAASATRAAQLSIALAKQLSAPPVATAAPAEDMQMDKHRGYAALASHKAKQAKDSAQGQAVAARAEYNKVLGIGLWRCLREVLQTARCGSWLAGLWPALCKHPWLRGVRKLLPRRRLHVPASLQSSLRFVVFVDDLDRCKPSKVVEVLEAVHLVLADSGCSVLLGVDKTVICNALMAAYKDNGIKTQAEAEAFLLKVVQVDLALPRPSQAELVQYLEGLDMVVPVDVEAPAPQPQQVDGAAAAAVRATAAAAGAATAAGGTPAAAAGAAAAAGGTMPAAAGAAAAAAAAGGTMPAAAGAAAAAGGTMPAAAGAAAAAGGTMPAAAGPAAAAEGTMPAAAGAMAADQSMAAPVDPAHELQLLRNRRGYSDQEGRAMQLLLGQKLLEGVSPRDIKRLLNRYRLAKYIMLEQYTERQEFMELGERVYEKLLGWVALWWRYPAGMAALMQYGAQEEWSDMKQLAQLGTRQHIKQQQDFLQQQREKKKRNEDDTTAQQQLKVWQQEQKELDKITALLGVQEMDAASVALIQWMRTAGPFSSRSSSQSSTGDAAQQQQLLLQKKRACEELLNIQRQEVDKFKTFGWGFV